MQTLHLQVSIQVPVVSNLLLPLPYDALESLQEGRLHEQDPGLPRLKVREFTGNHPPALLSIWRFAARLTRDAQRGYALLLCTMSLGSACDLTTDQPPEFRNKSEKGQIKPFISWVCIKWGNKLCCSPEAPLPREVFETFVSWRNYRVQLSSCKYHRRLERTNVCIGFIPCDTTSFVCDLSDSSASPGPHFPIQFLKSVVSTQTGKIKRSRS